MKVLLDERKLYINDVELNKVKLLNRVQKQLDNAIIDKIYLDEREVTFDYFTGQEINIDDYEKIEFVSKKTDKLIEETLLEAKDYLPELKQGLSEISRLMKRRETQLAGNKFLLALEGLEWYTGVLDNLQSLIDDEKLEKQIEEKLNQFTVLIKKALKLQKENDREELADMLSGDIVKMVDRFIDLNNSLINFS